MSNYPGALSGGFVSHRFVSLKADQPDLSLVNPTNWNQSHIIGSGAIQSGALGASMVNSGNVSSNAIISGSVASGAVIYGTLASGAISSGGLAANAVTSGNISALSVTSGAIASGATSWNLFGSSKPFVTVTPNGPTDGGDYGPNTPGTTTAGIQEAINAIAGFGGRVFVTAGKYTAVSSTITVPQSVWVEGAGTLYGSSFGGTVIATTANNLTTFKITGNHSKISSMYLSATGTGTVGIALAAGISYPILEEIMLQGFDAAGIRSLASSSATAITGGLFIKVAVGAGTINTIAWDLSYVNDSRWFDCEGSSCAIGFSLKANSGVIFYGGYCDGNTTHNFIIADDSTGAGTGSQLIKIIGFHIGLTGTLDGVLIQPSKANLQNIQLIGCDIYGCNVGVNVTITGTGKVDGLLVVACHIYNNINGIYFTGNTASNFTALFSNNYFESNTANLNASVSYGGAQWFNNLGDQPRGWAGLNTPVVPASGSSQQNIYPFRVRIYILTATSATYAITDPKNNATVSCGALTAGQEITLDPFAAIKPTYATLTWVWYGA